MLKSRVSLDIKDWYAIDYETLANYFFLGIWEAADGSEIRIRFEREWIWTLGGPD
jgi:hypothetical protein